MANLDRILELAGLKSKSLHTKELSEKTLEELEHDKLCYQEQIKGAKIVTEALAGIRLKLFQTEQAIETKRKVITEAAMANIKEPCSACQKTIHNDKTCECECHSDSINEHLTQVNGKWAIVSKTTGKPLRYYKGEGKPSDEWVKKQEKSIQYFKNMGESHLTEEKDSKGNEISVDTWFERDRANVTVYKNGKEVAEWWDDDVRQLVEDGFLNPKDWEGSAIDYCKHLGLLESNNSDLNEVAPTDQEEFVKSSKADFKKRYGKRWKKVLYATAWKRHNEGLAGDSFGIADKLFEEEKLYTLKFECPDCGNKWTTHAKLEKDDECPKCGVVSKPKNVLKEFKDAEKLQDSQPTSAQGKDDVGNVFDGHDEEKADADKLHQDAMGITQDRETKVNVPADVFSQIEKRIGELKQSMELYDKTTYKMHYDNKQKAVENLEFIRDKLKMGNMEGYKQAQTHYGTLASIYAGNLFPAKLVDFLHDGQASEKREVSFGDYMKGEKDKPTEGEVPGNSIYKTLTTSIYPQKGEDNVPKK